MFVPKLVTVVAVGHKRSLHWQCGLRTRLSFLVLVILLLVESGDFNIEIGKSIDTIVLKNNAACSLPPLRKMFEQPHGHQI